MINHNNITLTEFKKLCENAEEIIEKHNIDSDEALRDYFKDENRFKTEFGYTHQFYIVDDKYTVDTLIYPTIKLLNDFNFKTRFSCQGNRRGEDGYIAFDPSLSYEDRLALTVLTHNMCNVGLSVSLDRDFVKEGSRPIIRFALIPVANYYPNSFWEDAEWQRTKLTNILLYDAVVLFLSNIAPESDLNEEDIIRAKSRRDEYLGI